MATVTTERDVTYERPTYGIGDGIVGGVIGGGLMGMVSMVAFPLLGFGGFWQPMNLIGALFDQSWGTIAGFALVPSLVGMMIHMMMSGGMGALYAWSAGRSGRKADAGVIVNAVIASIVVWGLADFLVLPIINPIMTQRFPEWLFALVHVMYALGLGGYLLARGRRASETEHMRGRTSAGRAA